MTAAAVKQRQGKLLRILGLGFGLAVIIGNTIGAGILRTPGEVAAYLPGTWLYLGVWLTGGLYALLGANSIAELGAMIPRSGGQYVFVRRALGDYPGFIVGWSDWVSTCGSVALIAMVIAEYSGVLIQTLSLHTTTLASAIAISFAILQWRGVRWGSSVQNLTSLLKALAFIALVAACFIFGGAQSAQANSSLSSVVHNRSLFLSLILALQAVIYTYDGWTGVIYFSEEVREPGRDIPRALLGGALSVIVIYLLVNLALIYVLPLSRIAGDPLAVGAATQVIFGAQGEMIIRWLMIISMLSSLNACSLMASRVLFGLGRDSLFSDRASAVNQGGTPTTALLMGTLVSVFFIVTGTFNQVIAVLAFFFVLNYTLSFLSVFVLRRTEPETPRPFRAWGYPWTTGLSLAGSVAFLVSAIVSDTRNSVRALLLLAASYPVFLLLRRSIRLAAD
ncbi:MAG TPA: APC family permease [Blastocatellia bacterium]|nr:APC family permease [Blastocatellia bacterium]